MGLLPWKIVKKTSQPLNNSRLLNPRDTLRILGFDSINIFGSTTKEDLLRYFSSVPEVFQVLTTDARMFGKMNLTVKDKAKNEDVKGNNKEKALLDKPNWYQSKKEFLIQDRIFRNIHGEQFLYLDLPMGMPVSMAESSQLFTLNPYFLELIEPSGGKPPFMRDGYKEGTKYEYNYESQIWNIPIDDVLHLNNANAKDNTLNGVSRLEALKPNIENIIAAYESRGVLLRNRGALGILSNNAKDQLGATMPLDSEETKRVQDDYKKYGLTKDQWQIIITNLNLRWQSMAMKPADLMVFEEIEEDFRKLCDAFGFKAEMFSTKSGSTFENATRYEKSAYQNTIIPDAQEYVDGLNAFFGTADKPYTIVGEFQDLPIFDEDKKEKAQTIQLTTSSLSQQYNDQAISLEEYQRLVREMWAAQFR